MCIIMLTSDRLAMAIAGKQAKFVHFHQIHQKKSEGKVEGRRYSFRNFAQLDSGTQVLSFAAG